MKEQRYWLTDGTECNVLHDLEEKGVVVEYYTAGAFGDNVPVIKFLPYSEVLNFDPLPARFDELNRKIEQLQKQEVDFYKRRSARLTSGMCGNCKHFGSPVYATAGYFDCNRVVDERENDGEPAFVRGYDGNGLYLAVTPTFSCALFEEKPDNED